MALVVQDAAETICVRVLDGAVVDAVHDVLQLALARGGQEDAGHALALQVLGQAFGVAPAAGVVHHQGVVDAVGGVVDRGGVVRVDDLDLHAVGGDGVGFLVHADGAFEGAVDGVAAQQAGALGEVVVRAAAHHDGAQAQAVAAACLFDEEAGQEPADPAEAVKHNVGAGAVVGAALAHDLGQFGAEELFQGGAVALCLELLVQAGDVDRCGAQLQAGQGVQQRGGLFQEQLVLAHPAGEAVRLEDVHGGLVDQAAAVDAGDHVVFAVQPADHRNHGLGEGLPAHPRIKTRI